jgi:hypothetical protein
MRYSLRTLVALTAIGPPVLALLAPSLPMLPIIVACLAVVWLLASILFRLAVTLEPPKD